ncbi:MAG: helix-turn-helix transcriptional regulator [Clostridia bacterium]|nr:helix-turn-helix transcriptional regulator [Clostridia bacterium]
MINDTVFSNSFIFRTFEFARHRKNDNMSGTRCHYLALMLEGTARLVSDDVSVEIFAGDVFYIPLGKKYTSYWYEGPAIRFISLGFGFLPVFSGESFDMQRIECSGEEKALFHRIMAEEQMSAKKVGEFYTLVGLLLPRMREGNKRQPSELVRRARSVLTAEPRISNSELARRCAVSESALYLAFKRHSDVSINTYRTGVLMDSAKEQLISTDIPIEELSERLGFSSPSYFRKQFRSHFGISPREMRKQYKF